MGRLLAEEDLAPDLVLCSTARRAVETVELLLTALASAPETNYLKTLYLAPPSRLLTVLRRQGTDHGRILLVAHNPGLHHLAVALAGGQGAAGRLRAEKVPTAALARSPLEVLPARGQNPARLTPVGRPPAHHSARNT